MSETVSHEGVVTQVTDEELQIKIIAKSACAGCHAKSACRMSEMTEKTLTLQRPKGQDFAPLQQVEVKMTVGQGNMAAVLAYVIPIVILLAVLSVLITAGTSEGLAALISIAALVPYYIILYLLRGKLKKRFECEVRPYPDKPL